MDVTLSLGSGVLPRTVSVVGGLDVGATNEFSQVILALHDIVGSDVVYDFRGVQVHDDAARSTIAMLAHKFREFGRSVALPDSVALQEAAPLLS